MAGPVIAARDPRLAPYQTWTPPLPTRGLTPEQQAWLRERFTYRIPPKAQALMVLSDLLPMAGVSLPRLSRGARAGFDLRRTLYHATDSPQDFSQFKAPRRGIYLAESPQGAEAGMRAGQFERSMGARPRVMPVVTRRPIAGLHSPEQIGPIKVPKVIRSEQEWRQFTEAVKSWANTQPRNVRTMALDAMRHSHREVVDKSSPWGVKLVWTPNRTVMRGSKYVEETTAFSDWKTREFPEAWSYADEIAPDEAAKRLGFRGIVVADEAGFSPVIFDPADVKSIWANFKSLGDLSR